MVLGRQFAGEINDELAAEVGPATSDYASDVGQVLTICAEARSWSTNFWKLSSC